MLKCGRGVQQLYGELVVVWSLRRRISSAITRRIIVKIISGRTNHFLCCPSKSLAPK